MEIESALESLFRHLSRHIALNEAERALCRAAFFQKQVRKKDFLLRAGDVCYTEHFVVKGCLRVYLIDREGKEHILQFAVEDWWVGDMRSFVKQTPSDFFIEAMETSELLTITKPALEKLYAEIPQFERFFRLLIQNGFIALQQRVLANLSQTAEERYVAFVERYPNLEQRVPQHQIAAYLGMSPEFLSRIRRQHARR